MGFNFTVSSPNKKNTITSNVYKKNENIYRNEMTATVSSPTSSKYNQQVSYTDIYKGSMLDGLDVSNVNKYNMFLDIYKHDAICGSAVDLMSTLPYSEFSLIGIDDPKVVQIFLDSMEEMNIQSLLPELTVDYLVFGTFVGSMLFNSVRGIFTDVIPHSITNLELTPIPLYDRDPKIDLNVSTEFKAFLTSKDPRDIEAYSEIPEEMRKELLKGKIQLKSENTLWLPRRTNTNPFGLSVYERIIAIHLLEKALIRGTIISANRRQKAITIIQAGDEEWTPSNEELNAISQIIIEADNDPVGAVVAMRRGLDFQEIRNGSDFWRWSEESDNLAQQKLKALGISDSFLSGDASFNSAETALSVFLESLRTQRHNITTRMFYQKIFPIIAKANDIKKVKADWQKATSLTSSVRIKGQSLDVSEYEIPQIQWNKQLQPNGDKDFFDTLSALEEKGIPVLLSTYASSAGLDINKLILSMDDDLRLRKLIADKKKEFGLAGGEDDMYASVKSVAKQEKLKNGDFNTDKIKQYNEDIKKKNPNYKKTLYDISKKFRENHNIL